MKGAEQRTLEFHRLHQPHVGLQSVEDFKMLIAVVGDLTEKRLTLGFFGFLFEFPQKFTV